MAKHDYDIESNGKSSSRSKRQVKSFGWSDVYCSYTNKQGKNVKILHNIAGYIERGNMVAVIGPSGAGKTCFLDILAQRKTVGHIGGQCYIDDTPCTPKQLKKVSAYVTQEDTFHPTQTVFEAVFYQAELKLGWEVSKAEKEALCHKLLAQVGLQHRENTYVGGPLPGGLNVRGLSGGEKRRLSLCCGMITDPAILFLDEPTSGLDSMAALMVMRVIRQYCNQGTMVVCTIHQPRPAIWSLFEKVLVLAAGHEVYFGEASEAQNWFENELKFPKPELTSTVDYVLDLVNVGFENKDPAIFGEKTMHTYNDLKEAAHHFKKSAIYQQNVPFNLEHSSPNSEMSLSIAASDHFMTERGQFYGVSKWGDRFRIVLKRNFNNYIRNPGNVLVRVLTVILVSSLQGMVYMGTGDDNSGGMMSVFYRMGSFFFSLFAVSLLPFASLSLFVFDRQFYAAESAQRLYPCSVYYVSNMMLETLLNTFNAILYGSIVYSMIGYDGSQAGNENYDATSNFMTFLIILIIQTNVGSMILQAMALITPTQDMAFAAAAGYNAISVLCAGYVVSYPSFPAHAKPLMWISYLKFPFQAMVINEFRFTKFDFVVHDLMLDQPSSIAANCAGSLAIYFVAYMAGYFALAYLYKEKR